MIVAGSRSQALAARLSRVLDEPLAEVEKTEFPDGERLVRVPDVAGSVTVVASTPTDSSWIELLQILDACRGADTVDVVIPYMGYSRQDQEFEEGEAVSARALSQALPDVDTVTTVNVHEPAVLEWFDSEEARDVDACGALARELRDVDDPLVLAPDESASSYAESFAAAHGDADFDHLVKHRVDGDDVEMETKELAVDGRDVVVVDDMISTGGTVSEAVDILLRQGAEDVYAACIHPVLAGDAVVRLHRAGVERIVATDTLESAVSEVSVAEEIADSLRRSR